MKRANQPRKQIFPASLLSNISVSTFYKHIRTPPPPPPPSISISHLRQFTSLYSPPCIFIFSIFIFPIQSCFFLAPSSPIYFQENKFEGAKDTVFQSYTENLKTLKKKKKENLSGLKFNHPKNIRENPRSKDQRIQSNFKTLELAWICFQEISIKDRIIDRENAITTRANFDKNRIDEFAKKKREEEREGG